MTARQTAETGKQEFVNPLVQDYLDTLLQTATLPTIVPEPEKAETTPVVKAEPVSEPVAVKIEQQVQMPDEPSSDAVSRKLTRPEWTESPFACLLFEVKGMKIAAPLIELGGITELTELTPLFAQPEWFMGLLRWNDRNIKVIDTARLIMPGQPVAEQDYDCVLMLDGTDWGLAIGKATESITLDPAAVRWRSNLGNRPWLLGTVADRLCALLDVRAIATRLGKAGGTGTDTALPKE